ncbi:MAG TPA: stage V sporulation protein AD, partial [Candidatus Avamphibacillus intestinigallinarum]|nr:stage V sporulation protein AD [Candidatus Avamphibacillus intestinigallinarum]
MNPKQSTWIFEHKPYIVAASTVGGPLEAAGHIKDDFDLLYDDMRLNEDSFEKAQQRMLEETATHAIVKANLTNQDIDCFIAGDLINQLTPTNQAA